MSNPNDKKPPQSKTVQLCATVFTVIGVVGFGVGVAPSLFPAPRGGGINFTRILAAGVVGGVFALIGMGVGKLIEAMRK